MADRPPPIDAPRFAQGCVLPHKVLVGTHHKGGTVWLNSLFRHLCDFHGIDYFAGDWAELPERWSVFFQNHSVFELERLEGPCRGLHLIRDPRDLAVSGCFYHQKSDEEWLHEPRADLGGRTYRQCLDALADPDDRLLFELEHCARESIEAMLAWDYRREEFLEMKYETLIEDHDLLHFHRVFTFLGFPGEVMPSLLSIAWAGSLFSGRIGPSTHVRSGRGGQWRRHFKAIHGRRFVELFGDALVRLGYEEDDRWLEEIQ